MIYDKEKKDLYWQIAGLEHELKQYKDIEEELGIDLTILFKALKNGIYYPKSTYISYLKGNKEHVEFFSKKPDLVSYMQIENPTIKATSDNGKKSAVIEIHGLLGPTVFYHKYGKTWALDKKDLTKEELE